MVFALYLNIISSLFLYFIIQAKLEEVEEMRSKMLAIEERRNWLLYQMDMQLNEALPKLEKDIVDMNMMKNEEFGE